MEANKVVSRAKAYLKVRQKRVRDAMKALKLDALLLTHPPDLAYLTNFTGDDSIGVITEKDFVLVTDFRYQEQAEQEAGWLKLRIRDGKMSDALAKALFVGFEANFTAFGQVHALDRAVKEIKGAGPIELVPLEDVMTNVRKVKDDHEIDLIRKSVGVAEEAFEAIRAEIKVGLSENHLAGLLIFELRSRGASDGSFPAIAPLLFDWGALYKGYCSDLTRTLMIGRVSARMKKIYSVVLEAQQAAIAFLRPGVTTLQADRVARDVIEKAGFGKQFGHGLGHGIGRDIHELPSMRKNGGEEELRPGMIVTVEPGIYLPGEGGVRIEDDVLITHSGHEVLSTLDRSFEGCHLE
jgi:Xaa-Pro aminopeptidase